MIIFLIENTISGIGLADTHTHTTHTEDDASSAVNFYTSAVYFSREIRHIKTKRNYIYIYCIKNIGMCVRVCIVRDREERKYSEEATD